MTLEFPDLHMLDSPLALHKLTALKSVAQAFDLVKPFLAAQCDMRTGRHCGRLVTSTFAQDMASVALTAEFADTWFDWPADDDGLVVKIPAHRVVLCEAPYFASMLSGRFREASRDDASLSMAGMAADGMDVYVFQAALQWMYTGSRVELDAMAFDQGTEGTRKGGWLMVLCGIVVELLVMANMLGLDGLVSVCTSILSKLVATSKSSDVSSVCFEVAESLNMQRLKTQCEVMLRAVNTTA
ncbi:hypothetical protein DYB26_008543 [Aphanomyces astaci]|uniref:BTB domain-containing protein n=2 Tax=Aphanomyces astaci TaxID=112090 RepID=A0A418ECE0_APHAT|nr:hypothetical protein DYB26_008543 [Aphanomyces astaci]